MVGSFSILFVLVFDGRGRAELVRVCMTVYVPLYTVRDRALFTGRRGGGHKIVGGGGVVSSSTPTQKWEGTVLAMLKGGTASLWG